MNLPDSLDGILVLSGVIACRTTRPKAHLARRAAGAMAAPDSSNSIAARHWPQQALFAKVQTAESEKLGTRAGTGVQTHQRQLSIPAPQKPLSKITPHQSKSRPAR